MWYNAVERFGTRGRAQAGTEREWRMAGFLSLKTSRRVFGPVRAVDHVSLAVGKGDFYSLLGPSGCGRPRAAARRGFEQPDTGGVILDGQDITHLPPNRRQVNTIFQSYALFPT